jgi:hypothetical protein
MFTAHYVMTYYPTVGYCGIQEDEGLTQTDLRRAGSDIKCFKI